MNLILERATKAANILYNHHKNIIGNYLNSTVKPSEKDMIAICHSYSAMEVYLRMRK